MSGNIFINYRRSDEWSFALLLYGQLERKFRPEQIFMDVDSIAPGEDFVRLLNDKVAQSDVFLAVIGQDWLDARDKKNEKRRLDDPADFVRIEIEKALRTSARIIPLLVGGAQMPDPNALPPSMRELCNLHAVSLSAERFKGDAQQLLITIEKALADVADDRKRDADAWARALHEGTADALRGYISAFPKGRHGQQAAEQMTRLDDDHRRDEEAWEKAARKDTADALRAYLTNFPKGRHAQEAKERLAELSVRKQVNPDITDDRIRRAEELNNWEFVKARQRESELREHLETYQNGTTKRMARVLLEQVVWARVAVVDDLASLDTLLTEFPDGEFAQQARERRQQITNVIEDERREKEEERRKAEEEKEKKRRKEEEEEAAWAAVRESRDSIQVQNFLARWPESRYVGQARAAIAELDARNNAVDLSFQRATVAEPNETVASTSLARWILATPAHSPRFFLVLCTLAFVSGLQTTRDYLSHYNGIPHAFCAALLLGGTLLIFWQLLSASNEKWEGSEPERAISWRLWLYGVATPLSLVLLPGLAWFLAFYFIVLDTSWPFSDQPVSNVFLYALPLTWLAALDANRTVSSRAERLISLSYAASTILTLTAVCLWAIATDYYRYVSGNAYFPPDTVFNLLCGLLLFSYAFLAWLLHRTAPHLSRGKLVLQACSLFFPLLSLFVLIGDHYR